VIAEPPSLTGAVKLTIAEPSEAMAVTLVGAPGTAVEQQHLQLRVVTDPPGPYIEATDRRVDGNSAGPAAQSVFATGVVKISFGGTHSNESTKLHKVSTRGAQLSARPERWLACAAAAASRSRRA